MDAVFANREIVCAESIVCLTNSSTASGPPSPTGEGFNASADLLFADMGIVCAESVVGLTNSSVRLTPATFPHRGRLQCECGLGGMRIEVLFVRDRAFARECTALPYGVV